jgi:hypothetical protein
MNANDGGSRPLCNIPSWQSIMPPRLFKNADLPHVVPIEKVSNILQEMILAHELDLCADGFQRRMRLLAHLGVHGVQTHRSAENRAIVGV